MAPNAFAREEGMPSYRNVNNAVTFIPRGGSMYGTVRHGRRGSDIRIPNWVNDPIPEKPSERALELRKVKRHIKSAEQALFLANRAWGEIHEPKSVYGFEEVDRQYVDIDGERYRMADPQKQLRALRAMLNVTSITAENQPPNFKKVKESIFKAHEKLMVLKSRNRHWGFKPHWRTLQSGRDLMAEMKALAEVNLAALDVRKGQLEMAGDLVSAEASGRGITKKELEQVLGHHQNSAPDVVLSDMERQDLADALARNAFASPQAKKAAEKLAEGKPLNAVDLRLFR
jgi:hypothetical protein